MSSAENAIFERCASADEDVWFLSGPTQPGEEILHSPIDGDPFTVGRNSGVSLRLRFRTVSGTHASLWVEDGKLFLKDLGSTNGTYVNGTRINRGETVQISEEDLIQVAEAPFRVRRQSPTSMIGTYAENVCDQALAMVQFDRLMSQRLVRPHFQSIVELTTSRSIGYEILGRSSVFGLESPMAMFEAATQLNLEVELSRMLRWEGVRVGRDMPDSPTLFVNTHPREVDDLEGLIDSLKRVREMTGKTELVLEIHESSVTNPELMIRLQALLRELDIRLAYDDFGAGQARLAELVAARPDYLKFDISLIRDIDNADESRRKMMDSLVNMVRDLGIKSVAEGIETAAEAEACVALGFEYAQGYYFGQPAPM